ncbi:MAG TPA: hypothetical protein VFF73_36510 [Planctomycetota bacterium]|nr:hypothetical protein [Planctomycetota bacterium]
MNEKQRTAILGGVAVLVLGVGAVRVLFKGSASDETVGVARRDDKGGVGHVGSGVPVDPRKLYQAILDVDPFKPRLFTTKRGPRNGKDPGEETGPPVRGPGVGPAPGYVAVRLTCIESTKQGAEGLLEERETGKGIFVKKGQKIGECTIADVTTNALLVEFANTVAGTSSNTTTKKIEFGDRLDLKQVDLALTGLLKDLGPIKSSTAAVGSEGWGGQPPLSPERAKSVLEALREKRRKSLGLPPDDGTPVDKPADKPGDKPKEDTNAADNKKDGPK